MKTLLLIRHAKTSWLQPTTPDKERPLEERGIHDAKLLSEHLSQKQLKPEFFICSTAVRTQQTAEIIAEYFKFPQTKVILSEEMYEAGVEDLLHVLQTIDNQWQTALMVGHNPAITMLANYLGNGHIATLQTSGACCIDLMTDEWSEITTAEGKIRFEYHPPHDI